MTPPGGGRRARSCAPAGYELGQRRLGRVPHDVPRRLQPRPQLELTGALVDEHPEAVHGPAPLRRRGGEEGRAERVVHEVGHDLARPQAPRVHRQRAVLAHAERRGLHEEVGATDVVHTSGAAPFAGQGGRGRSAAGRAVHDDDLPAACVGQRPDHGPGRPARAEHHRGHARRVDPVVEPERVEEALPVGALAPEPAVRHHHDGVGRAQRLDRGAALVDQRGDVGLVGHRHGQPGQAEGPHRVQRAAGAAGRDLEGDVAPVQPARREGGVVHRGREAVADGRSDDPGHPRPAADRQRRRRGPAHPSSPAARAFATFFRWSSYVVAKAWRPLLSAST